MSPVSSSPRSVTPTRGQRPDKSRPGGSWTTATGALAKYRAAPDADADPTVVARWMAEAKGARLAAERELAQAGHTGELPAEDIGNLVASLSDIPKVLAAPTPRPRPTSTPKWAPLYLRAGLAGRDRRGTSRVYYRTCRRGDLSYDGVRDPGCVTVHSRWSDPLFQTAEKHRLAQNPRRHLVSGGTLVEHSALAPLPYFDGSSRPVAAIYPYRLFAPRPVMPSASTLQRVLS
jgi:hypothetical protein